MKKHVRVLAAAGGLLIAMSALDAALAQKSGGILKMYSLDSPPSMSMLDGFNPIAQRTTMEVFNNLVMFDQNMKQNSLQSIVPDLATGWSWNEEGTALTLPLRQGVRWHDGKPFTAKDVQCTWDLLLEKSSDRLRFNPLKSWYRNLEEVTTNGDYEVTFHLKRPQPAFLMLLADGFAPTYPCHVPAREMRSHPIGTGPFKFAEFKPNESIKVTRNGDYWKKDRPYLDGIEYTIIRNLSTATLAFISGQLDMTFPYTLTVPLLKDVRSQMPDAICELAPDGGIHSNLIVNRDAPPFDNLRTKNSQHNPKQPLDRKGPIQVHCELALAVPRAVACSLPTRSPPASASYRLKLDILRCGFSRQHRRQQHAVVCEPRLITDHRVAWRPSAHLVSSSTSRAAAIPLPTMTSGSLTGYPFSAPDCDHMLRKSCSWTACHRRCPTHPPLPASSHPPGPSRASTATRRRPPDSAPPSHRS
jgi:Bacterial extracellular solute-binding proteins, family 5 Middle